MHQHQRDVTPRVFPLPVLRCCEDGNVFYIQQIGLIDWRKTLGSTVSDAEPPSLTRSKLNSVQHSPALCVLEPLLLSSVWTPNGCGQVGLSVVQCEASRRLFKYLPFHADEVGYLGEPQL